MLLIEHDMRLVMGVTDRIVVLEFGKKIARGPARRPRSARIRRSLAAYLGCPKMTLLELTDAVVGYGRIEALHGISIRVDQGEIVTLIGANGAGKTTTMRAISGVRPFTKGTLFFTMVRRHHEAAGRPSRGRGISQAPEGRGRLLGLTVAENLDMGAWAYARDHKNLTD